MQAVRESAPEGARSLSPVTVAQGSVAGLALEVVSPVAEASEAVSKVQSRSKMPKETSFHRVSRPPSSISSSNSLGSQASWQALPALQRLLLPRPLRRPAVPNPRAATDGRLLGMTRMKLTSTKFQL